MRDHPAVANVTQVDGYSLIDSQHKTNFGVLFVSLKDYEERKSPGPLRRCGDRRRAQGVLAASRTGWWCPVNPPAIPGLGITAGFQMWIEQKGAAATASSTRWWRRSSSKAKTRPELAGVNTTIRANGQQLLADVDREKAEILGVPVQDVYDTLQTMFGSPLCEPVPQGFAGSGR